MSHTSSRVEAIDRLRSWCSEEHDRTSFPTDGLGLSWALKFACWRAEHGADEEGEWDWSTYKDLVLGFANMLERIV